jgi:hypothetical protein
VLLQLAVGQLAWTRLVAGDVAAATSLIEEDRLIAAVSGTWRWRIPR